MVVLAHCIHVWLRQFSVNPTYPSLGFAAALLDQSTRFTVPAFLFLSGYVLATQARKQPNLNVGSFYRKRMAKITAPFFLWSAITSFRHEEYFLRLPWSQDFGAALSDFLFFLCVRGFDYQYYFLIVIFQFYLLFPFLVKAARSKRFFFGAVFINLLLIQPADQLWKALGLQQPVFHSHFIATHLLFCIAGMHLAWNRRFLQGALRKLTTTQTVVIWGFSFALLNGEFLYNLSVGKPLYLIDHFNRWTVIFYCGTTLLLFLKIRPHLHRHFHTRPSWNFIYKTMAPYTYFVYLFHTHLLRVADKYFWEVSFGDMAWRLFFVVVGSYAVGWLVQWLLEDFPRLRYALALPDAPLKREELPGFCAIQGRPSSPPSP
jgi:surface polysaccharide O-acyltransferase-like enzyme